MEYEQGSKPKREYINLKTAGECGTLLDKINVNIISYLLDDDCTIIWASDHFYNEIGYSKEEYQSRFGDLHKYYSEYPEDFEALKIQLLDTLKKGKSEVELTVKMPIKKGGFEWFRLSATITDRYVDDNPVVSVVLSNVNDIVHRQDELALLYENKAECFEWMMDEYHGNIYISDMQDYELLYMNKTALDYLYETLHLTSSDIIGRKCYEIIQGRTSPCPFCTNDRLCEDEFYEWEFFNTNLDRTFMIKNRIVNWNGHRARIELSHDMFSPEYKLAKKDREREALLRTIPGGFARLDARDYSTVLWYGAGFLQMIGYTKKQFENELHSQCTYIHPEDIERQISIMNEIRQTGQSAVYEARVISHDGEMRILTMTLCYVSGEDSWDGIPSFYSVGIDVTKERAEQERQRKALEDAYLAARVASSAKTNFLSSMSHDIRTPMNAIIGMTAIAQVNLASTEKVKDCLNKINISSRHLLSLINEVLDMSKIESGKIDLVPENVDLSDLIQNVADMCRPLIAEKHQEFQVSVGMVRHEKVITDGDRLKQVLMNLLSNAIKYTPEGGTISLRINELFSFIPNKGQYEFILIDNGIGMSNDFIPHIFEPFSRAEDSRISKIQGTGLGMAITENIVRMMNGTIEVQSELGTGSQFTVSIPLELINEEETYDNELACLPVLVVDDDQIVCENATALLNELGMRGYWVLSGIEAVKCVEDAHKRCDDFFAIILDWKMPEMDGLATVRTIREKLGDNVPIIIISAYDYSDIEEEFIRAGADAFITKPLFKSKMLHVLQLFCGSSKQDATDVFAEEKCTILSGKRVLLAEDNDLNREIAIELLRMQGINVTAVENGQRAVEAFSASDIGEYSAILMDVQMPVLNGYEATGAIRAMRRDDAHTIPILALTANAFPADVGKARSVGMNYHIAKPIDVDHLIEVLKIWLK